MGVEIDFLPDLHLQHDIGLMHVHMGGGICFQDRFADHGIELLGIKGISLVEAPDMHLEALIGIRILAAEERDGLFLQLIRRVHVRYFDGADTDDAEYML